MNDSRRAFLAWTDCLLDPTSSAGDLWRAAHDWCTWAVNRLGIDESNIDPPGTLCGQPTLLPGGEAISPQRAVLCLREHWRTAVFLRATDAAIRAAQERFPGEMIHLVEAGCGPAAPMAMMAAARYSPAQVQVTLLDIHEASLADARRLATELGVERSLRACVCGDAAAVRFAEADRPHVIVCEVLRRALKKEPQVAVTRALAPQLRPGGFFLPEWIEIAPGYVRGSPTSDAGRRIERFDAAFTLDACAAGALLPDATGRLPERAVNVSPGAAGQLHLLTRLRVFREHELSDFECSLTMPERLRLPAGLAASGGALRFAYEISSNPGLRLVSADLVTTEVLA